MNGSRTTLGLLACAVLLTGCSANSSGAADGPSLVETKSAVQLLRNDAAGRLESDLVDRIRKTNDASVPCTTDDGNPGGLIRQWKSSADLSLVAGADRVEAARVLVQSFVDQGWVADITDEGSAFEITVLTKPGSVATLEVAGADESRASLVRVVVTGPCVVTGGPDSEEVTELG